MKGKKREFVDDIKNEIKKKMKEKGIESLSEVLEVARQKYVKEISQFGIKDPEQSWKPFKGSIIEEIILESLIIEVEKVGLKAIKGSELEKEESKLNECLSKVKRSVVVDYGEFGMHLPDADIVMYDPEKCRALAVISSKATLRERVAQTGYWFLKLKGSRVTENIKAFFITLDEDGDLIVKHPAKKGRAIAEIDTDGTFVITNNIIDESKKVKKFGKFLEEVKKLKPG